MLVKDFITKEIPVLKSFDTGEYALALMDDFKLKHLPLLSENIYRCLVSEKDLLAMPDPTAIIGDPVLFSPSVQEDTHIYEALALVTRYQLSLLPVVSTEGEYRGAPGGGGPGHRHHRGLGGDERLDTGAQGA